MGTLYIVGTPIGNLEDITLRALRILREVDAIACEDTRHTGKMLAHFEIKKPLIRCDAQIENEKIACPVFDSEVAQTRGERSRRVQIVEMLKTGKDIAFVSDAGTPGISDPGARLTKEAVTNNIKVVPIPGVSAITSLYSVTGFGESNFLFLGFLPKKKGRETMFRRIKEQGLSSKKKIPIIIYESPYRVIRTLEDFQKIGEWDVVVGRELTKKFEEIVRGNIKEVIEHFSKSNDNGGSPSIKIRALRGEFSICLISQESK